MNKTAIFVVGMHRSGTSALAGLTEQLGAAMPKTLMLPQPDNPKGFFESYAVMALSDRMLAARGVAWDSLINFDSEGLADEFGKDISAVLGSEYEDAPLICVKDPRHCLILPPWLEGADRLGFRSVVAFCYRHPYEVALSLAKRNGMLVSKALLLWLRYVLSAEFNSRQVPRTFVSMSELVSDGGECIKRVGHALEIEWPVPFDVANQHIEAHVEPALKHYSHSFDAFDSEPLLRGWIKTAFTSLEGLRQGGAEAEHRQVFDELRLSIDNATALLGPLIEDYERSSNLKSEGLTLALAEKAIIGNDLEGAGSEILELKTRLHASEGALEASNAEREALKAQVMELAQAVHTLDVHVATRDEQNRGLHELLLAKDEVVRASELRGMLSQEDHERQMYRDQALAEISRQNANLSAQIKEMQQTQLTAQDRLTVQQEFIAALQKSLDDMRISYSNDMKVSQHAIEIIESRQAETLASMSTAHLDALNEVKISSNRLEISLSQTIKYLSDERDKLERLLNQSESTIRGLTSKLQQYREGNIGDYAGWAIKKTKRP